MDEIQNDKFIIDYEDAIDSTPDEVRDFLWSDAYQGYINGIAKFCNLNDAQKKVVSDLFFDVLIGESSQTDAEQRLTDASIDPTTQATIFALGYDYLIDTATQLTEEALSNEPSVIQPGSTNPTPLSLTSLANRLKQASVAAPAKPDYALEKNPISTDSTTPSKTAIDPYHESIDNE
jgi:hypothetical protein